MIVAFGILAFFVLACVYIKADIDEVIGEATERGEKTLGLRGSGRRTESPRDRATSRSAASPVVGSIWRWNYLDVLTQAEAEHWERNALRMGWSIIRDNRASPVRLASDGAELEGLRR